MSKAIGVVIDGVVEWHARGVFDDYSRTAEARAHVECPHCGLEQRVTIDALQDTGTVARQVHAGMMT